VAERRCSECPRPLGPHAPPNRKTCSDSCRSKRSRRLKRSRKKGGQNRAHPEELQALYQADAGKIEDAAMEVIRDEVRPVVREALTDDVLRSIQDLVNLTPTIVAKIRDDIEQDADKTLRQRAYTLVAKYTFGNPSVAPPPTDPGQQGLVVHFNMPRPGDTSTPTPEAQDVVELRHCVECDTDKPSDEFVGSSERCTDCHAVLQAKVAERFPDIE
jgi:hypothetical protein